MRNVHVISERDKRGFFSFGSGVHVLQNLLILSFKFEFITFSLRTAVLNNQTTFAGCQIDCLNRSFLLPLKDTNCAVGRTMIATL